MRIILYLLLLSIVFIGCSSSSSSDTSEVKSTIDKFLNFYDKKETKSLTNIFSEEPQAIVYGIGTEVWKGKERIIKKMKETAEDVDDSNIDVHDQIVKISGNTAWFSQRGDWSYDYKGQRVDLKGVRITGVLLNDKGQWKIVQWHTSMPVRQQ